MGRAVPLGNWIKCIATTMGHTSGTQVLSSSRHPETAVKSPLWFWRKKEETKCTHDYGSGIKEHIKLVALHFRAIFEGSHVSQWRPGFLLATRPPFIFSSLLPLLPLFQPPAFAKSFRSRSLTRSFPAFLPLSLRRLQSALVSSNM